MQMQRSNKEDFRLAVLRALIGRCPNCGNGRLFTSYLKQVDHCAACAENLGRIRADDGPAWLTILVVGHVMAPLMLTVGVSSTWPDWALMTAFPGMALILALAVLPRAKGAFIGIIWRSECSGAGK